MSLEKIVNDEPVWVEPVIDNDVIYVKPGKYRYKISTNMMQGHLASLLDVKEGSSDIFIYTETTPVENYVFSWATSAPKGSDEFAFHRSKAICVTPINEKTMSGEAIFSDYAYESCKAIESSKDPDVIYQIAHLLEYGEGVVENLGAAIKYYEQAFSLGSMRAGFRLVDLYDDNKGADYIRVLQKLSQKDFGEAYIRLSIAYLQGTGVGVDYQKADALALEAVKLGSQYGFLLLAESEYQEKGLNADYVEILSWIYLYQRFSSDRLEYYFTSMIRRGLDNLSKAQLQLVDLRVKEKISQAGELYAGKVVVGDLSNIPEKSYGRVSVSLNKSRNKISLAPGGNKVIDGVYTGRSKQYINVYAGEEFITSINFDFEDFDSENLCFVYQSDIDLYEFKKLKS